MKLIYCLLLVTFFRSQADCSECVKSHSKNCVILSLTSLGGSSDEVSLPNLHGKISLQIKAGNLTTFGAKLSSQLRSVQKLQLGPMGLTELFVNPELRDLTATDNQIHVVKLQPSEVYKLEKLDLQRNRLNHLGGFEVLTELIDLHLEENMLETLDFSVFAPMKNLKELHLERNQLTNVVTLNRVDLPEMDYLSLAGNKLTKLDVSNWIFGSMTTWDVSSNELIHIDGIGIEGQFTSLQSVLLSRNGWHCKWLNDTLHIFESNSVNIDDRDDECESGTRCSNICCASAEVSAENGRDQLDDLTQDQKDLWGELNELMTQVREEQENKFIQLSKLLNDLQEKSKTPLPTPTENLEKSQFDILTEQAQQLKSKLQREIDSDEELKRANDKSIRNLQYTILQLSKGLTHEASKISGLQKQFKLLREHSNKLQ